MKIFFSHLNTKTHELFQSFNHVPAVTIKISFSNKRNERHSKQLKKASYKYK